MIRGVLFLVILQLFGLACGPNAYAQFSRQQVLTITALDKAGYRHSIMVGFHDAATRGFDAELQEIAIPPVPAVQAFDFRIIDHPSRPRIPASGSYREFLPFSAETVAPPDTFLVRAQASENASPVLLYWDQLSAAQFSKAVILIGSRRINMTETTSCTLDEEASTKFRLLLLPSTSPR